MKTSKKAFGESYSEKFIPGEFIWWVTWEQREDYSIDSVVNRGVLIEIVTEPGDVTNKEVCFAKVLPFGSQRMIKINVMLLRKETN